MALSYRGKLPLPVRNELHSPVEDEETRSQGKDHSRGPTSSNLLKPYRFVLYWGILWLLSLLFVYRFSAPNSFYDSSHSATAAISPMENEPMDSTLRTSATNLKTVKTQRKTAKVLPVKIPCSSTNIAAEAPPLILTESLPIRPPNHHACEGYAGIYHIKSGDVGGAAGTIFFQFVIAQLIYADNYNLKPWIYLDKTSLHVVDSNVHIFNRQENQVRRTQFTMRKGMTIPYLEDYRLPEARYPGPPQLMSPPLTSHTFEFAGDGVWEHYFEPVSDFEPNDESCETKPYLTMDLFLITPGLHIYAPWTPRMWRYSILPDYLLKRHLTNREWLEPQRLEANRVAQKYIRPRQELWDAANEVNPSPPGSPSNSRTDCLGFHVRWTDKEGGRRLIDVDEFLPYVHAYVNNGGTCIFVATDSGKALRHMRKQWPAGILNLLRSQGDYIIRSDDIVPVFQKGATSHHRTNIEVLVDILALTKCRFLLHGLSAVTDSAMYLNRDLIFQSVDLEDRHRIMPNEFGDMVRDVLKGEGLNLTRFFPTPWWDVDRNPSKAVQTDHACDGYNGILHIEYTAPDASTGMSFFHYILNQLIYADMNNLKPWVFLSPASDGVFDNTTHANSPGVTFTMMGGMDATVVDDKQRPESLYPGDLVKGSKLWKKKFHFAGTGVWDSYLEPVSDFIPGDESCKSKPLVRLQHRLVEPGLRLWAPWALRSREYDDLPRHAGKFIHSNYTDWYEPMRKKAHEVIKKYYRFSPHIWKRVDEVLTVDDKSGPCLAANIAQVRDNVYVEYIEAFLRAGGTCIFVATGSWHVVDWLETLPAEINGKIIWQGSNVVRSVRDLPLHHLEERRHRINSEAFVDVLGMSRCQFLIHEFTTISEAAIYMNPGLHKRSVNVEDQNRKTVEEFEQLVGLYIAEISTSAQEQ